MPQVQIGTRPIASSAAQTASAITSASAIASADTKKLSFEHAIEELESIVKRLEDGKVPLEESGLAPKEIWCNESQERYTLAIDPARLEAFQAMCERERCPYAVVGVATDEPALVLEDGPGGERVRLLTGCDEGEAAARALNISLLDLLQDAPRLYTSSVQYPDCAIGKALRDGLWSLDTVNLRNFGVGPHRSVDDTPAGGGAGAMRGVPPAVWSILATWGARAAAFSTALAASTAALVQ